MPSWPRSPSLRSVALVAAASLAFLLLHRATGQSPVGIDILSRSSKMSSSKADPNDAISKLSVSLSQTSTSPPTLSVKVLNGNASPVTILTWDSPLDPAALSLGVVKITPAGADAPLELPTVMFRRVTPPGPDSLVTIEPGEAVERDIVFREPVVSKEQVFGDGAGKPARVVLKGRWTSVWLAKQADISSKSLENMGFADDSVTGDFTSDEIELRKD